MLGDTNWRSSGLSASHAAAACCVLFFALLPDLAGRSAQAVEDASKTDHVVKPPNVVVILADDYGWRDVGLEGSTFYETPHIDRIGREGMRFLQGYATCQVCSPSRASILTGKFPARHAITSWIGDPQQAQWKRNTLLLPAAYRHALPSEEITLAEAFRAAGYRTFFAGKWHLGGEGSLPEDHGFEVNRGGFQAGSPPGGYFVPYDNPKLVDGPTGESLPERLARETSDFIRAHKAEPFLAYLAFYSVHSPLQTTRPLWQKYRDRAAQLPAPTQRFVVDRTTPVRQVQDHPVYGGMVESMDRAVGIVLETLDQLALTDQTIVVFTSDNGGVSAGDGNATSNLPLRGGKGRQWEGGLRTPMYLRWPSVVKAESTSDVPATGADLFPTLLELTGLALLPQQHVDGVSLVPLLTGGAIAPRPLYWHYPHYGNQGGEPSSILRDGDWKLILYHEDSRQELYNLATDPGEQRDLAGQESQRTRDMAARLQTWLADVGARFPTRNPSYDAHKAAAESEAIRTHGLRELEREAAAFVRPDFDPGNRWWGSQPNN
ncbi:MAG: sulfatase [Pirellulaceae bacterium]